MTKGLTRSTDRAGPTRRTSLRLAGHAGSGRRPEELFDIPIGSGERNRGEVSASRQDEESRSPGTREKILEAAERLIAAHGAEGLQLEDVADAVGIRPASVYVHYLVDDPAHPIAGVPIEEIVRKSQDLAVRLLRISDE